MNRCRRLVAIVTLAASVGAVTGCSVASPQATAIDYTATDGVQTDLGPVQIRNVFVAARTKDAVGALQGVVVNTTDSPSTVTFTGTEGTVGTVTVPAGELVDLNTEPMTIQTVPVWPGETLPMTVATADNNVDLAVPVLDGTLPEYADLVPAAAPSGPQPAATPAQ